MTLNYHPFGTCRGTTPKANWSRQAEDGQPVLLARRWVVWRGDVRVPGCSGKGAKNPKNFATRYQYQALIRLWETTSLYTLYTSLYGPQNSDFEICNKSSCKIIITAGLGSKFRPL